MKSSFTFFFIFLFTITSTAQKLQENPTTSAAAVDTWLKESNVPGIAIAKIDDRKVSTLILEGRGENGQEITTATIFDTASLTKTITTLVALKLVENNKWNLDEPLYKYWIDPDIEKDARHKYLTTRHILSHRSGFKNWRWMSDDKKLAFDFKPGEKFQYSGEGFEYLRIALERKFETTLEQLSDSLVFQPFKMKTSSLVWNPKMEKLHFAGSHNQDGKPYEYKKAYEANAADNLLTSLEDFDKLAIAILDKAYLKNKLYEEMIIPHSNVREGIDFGLGWIIFKNLPDDEYALFNAGSDQGVNSLVVLLPKSKRGLVVMTNGDNGRGLAMKAIGAFLGDTGKAILGRF